LSGETCQYAAKHPFRESVRAAINRYLVETNLNPKPFTWTADPDVIIEKVRRGKLVLNDFGVAR